MELNKTGGVTIAARRNKAKTLLYEEQNLRLRASG